jgi:hypothetical protein
MPLDAFHRKDDQNLMDDPGPKDGTLPPDAAAAALAEPPLPAQCGSQESWSKHNHLPADAVPCVPARLVASLEHPVSGLLDETASVPQTGRTSSAIRRLPRPPPQYASVGRRAAPEANHALPAAAGQISRVSPIWLACQSRASQISACHTLACRIQTCRIQACRAWPAYQNARACRSCRDVQQAAAGRFPPSACL